MESLHKSSTSIKNWAQDDRPREKLRLKGALSLSDSELLAILIGTGSRTKSAVDLAKDVLALKKNNLDELGKAGVRDLMLVHGIGEAKAVTIAAALELGRRRQACAISDRTVIRDSKSIAEFLQVKLKDFNHEIFAVVFLNRANRIIDQMEIISSGGITGTVADPRMILRKALELHAVSMILSHNHPSGNLRPSRADEELTSKIKEAAKYFDIKVLDHIIVSDEGYFSFADEGML
jgi:DNA repair protein RadC